MNKYWWVILVLLIVISIGAYFWLKQKEEISHYYFQRADSLVQHYSNKADSLYRASEQKDIEIAKRDSIIAAKHTETKTVYIIRDKTNKKIANDTLKNSDISFINRYLDSLVRANR